jgi:membrane fusion protein, heavy metal efflux system
MKTNRYHGQNYYTAVIVTAIFFAWPFLAIAHGGHGNEFKQGETGKEPSIVVDVETAKRLGIKVESARSQPLEIGLKATGKIETLPDRSVEVTAPVKGKIVSLLVEPGAIVSQGQPLATMTSGELSDLRVSSQEKRAEALAGFQQAQVELNLARENYERYRQIAQAEINQAKSSLKAVQGQYDRDRALVKDRGVVKAAQNSYQRQVEIARSEIEQAKIEVNIAQDRYNQDRQLVASGALPRRQMLESQSKLAAAHTQLAKATNNPEVLKAEGELRKAEVDLPIRAQQESASQLAEAQAALTRALTQKEVIAAKAQLKRATANLEAMKIKLNLSDRSYQTRLQQLGTVADSKGLVTISAPISGTIADRTATIGQSFQDSGAKLMSIVNDEEVLATANIYEQDLNRVRVGQKVHVRVSSLPVGEASRNEHRLFTGTISRLGAIVGESRVVPVQARLNNGDKLLKPGMFAELEVITDRTSQSVVAIPRTALVEANGKKIVYIENGDKFQDVDVTLGRATGDVVEVKTGLFAGDRIVTQRGMLLYAQSLRGGSATDEHAHEETQPSSSSNPLTTPWVWIAAGGVTIATVGAVILWRRRRTDGGKLDLVNERFNEEEIDTILTGILEETELPALPPIEEPALKTRSE